MATNPSVPLFDHGDTFTVHAATALRGRRFVAVAGPRTEGRITAGYPTGGSGVIGVTAYDAVAGGGVTLHHQPAIIVEVDAGADLAAGDLVTADAEGRAVPAAGGIVVGAALDAAESGAAVFIDRTVRA